LRHVYAIENSITDINQRQATKEAGEIAGLEVVSIISEPVAACLGYGLEKLHKDDLKVVVFDIGGGTLDVTVGQIRSQKLVVKSTSGDTHLGGTDMDDALVDYLIEEFKGQSGLDVRDDKTAMVRMREAAERAKENVLRIDLENELYVQKAAYYLWLVSPRCPGYCV
jgi:molecular chaperone DnaK